MLQAEQIKVEFEKKGWTIRAAAVALGIGSFPYLCDVLNARRQSQRLLKAIQELPPFEEWKKANESEKS